jgi:hypothetical protein
VRPELPNPPATAELTAPPEVKQILETSCYDCHSNQTRVPWFDRIVPAYWLVVDDVQRGRTRLNFSEIGRLPAAQQRAAKGDETPVLGRSPSLRLLQGEGAHPRATLPVVHVPPYLQTLAPAGPLRLQVFEQQSAFVVQEEPDGKHPASVVVVVLVVAVVVVVGA